MSTQAPEKIHLTQGAVSVTRRGPLELECGATLDEAELRYAIYGEPNADSSNVTLVCHALSGTSRVDQWWPVLLETEFDLAQDCVICFNVIGSCYGSTSAATIDPKTGRPYGGSFPVVTVRDWVRSQRIALETLGVSHLKAAIGPSLGGMQAIQWAVEYPNFVDRIVAMGATPVNAMALGLNHIQRDAIRQDAEFRGGDYYDGPGPRAGLANARMLAMCTYKSDGLFAARHGRRPNRKSTVMPWQSREGKFDIAGYLDYQGKIFLDRFDANAYLAVTEAMDLFDPERNWGPEAYARIRAKVLLFGISSDILFPEPEVRAYAEHLRQAGVDCRYEAIVSAHGHDAFLAEPKKLEGALREFLHEDTANSVPQANLEEEAETEDRLA